MVVLSNHDHSASASSAISLKRKRSSSLDYDRYDVFLSFRGSDTRYCFTDHLYDHLKRAGIHTFRDDDELEKGERLKEQLETAIKQSSVSIIVFSENYASSSWCLDELVRILEQKKKRGNYKVLPIFYHVDPSDVRYQRGSYKDALNGHRAKGIASLEKIQTWEAALTEAVNFVGLDLNKGRQETKFIGTIVCEVENNLPKRKALDVPECLVGMRYHTKRIGSWLKDRSSDNNVLVICGMGGIGKTTIAKHLFNEYFQDFEGSCFLARITAMWGQIGVCGLQSQLLSSIQNKKEEIRIYNSDVGTEMIKRDLCFRKVIVVLDDVSVIEQLKALLGRPLRLCPGSKILVTTRDMSLWKDFTIHPKVHTVHCLNDDESLKLFSWHSFQQLLPLEKYMQLSKEILLRCEGLPLALEVLGSTLRRKLDVVFWKKQLRKWNEIGNPDVMKVMQISYDSLEDETVKNLFLHVACFFLGEEEDFVLKILDHCGLHATVGIQNLFDRGLIKTYNKKLIMHQVIQDMAREIVRKESPNEPGRRSRLWCEDSFAVLKNDMGTEAVQGLILDGQKINKTESDGSSFAATDTNPHLITKVLGYVKNKKVLDRFFSSQEAELKLDAFAKMVNLKFVKLNRVNLTGSCKNFPLKLIVISWHRFSLEYVPIELPLERLLALDLQHSVIKQVWKGYKEVKSLKFLNLSYSIELRQTPDFRGLPQLEKLFLRGCSNLVKICKTIGLLNGLVLLDLRDCRSLRDLPALPESIQMLKLSGCYLTEFPREHKTFDYYSIMKFASPTITTGPIKLLACLSHSLVKLSLEGCNLSDECFPRDFSQLSSLKELDLSGNLMSRLPDCIRNLSNSRLRELYICYCPHLQSIVHPPSTLSTLYLYGNSQFLKIKARQNHEDFCLVIGVPTLAGYIELDGCFRRVEAWNVERKVINNLGLESVPISSVGKVHYEFGIFRTIVKSSRVPLCFKTTYSYGEEDSEDRGEESEWVPHGKFRISKVQYTIPSSVGDKRIQGLNMCFAVTLCLDPYDYCVEYGCLEIYITVCNKTKDLAWTFNFADRLEEAEKYMEARVAFEDFLWVCTWKCVDLFDAGDEIEVSFHIHPLSRDHDEAIILSSVNRCGIRTIYGEGLEEEEKEEDINDNTLLWSDQMDVSFSNYRTPAATYYLRGRLNFTNEGHQTKNGNIVQTRSYNFLQKENVLRDGAAV